MSRDKFLSFVCKNLEYILIGLLSFFVIIDTSLYAFVSVISGFILSAILFVMIAIAITLRVMFVRWEKELGEYNESMKKRELKEGEQLIPLTPEQFEEYVKNGYVVMPDGSPLISDKLKKSNKMKHIKLEDYSRLNGPIITEENKDYDGPRILDYEQRNGKNYGIPIKEKGK